MSSATFPPISKTKRLCAGLLALWLSGVVLLFCCGAMEAKAAEIESCPLAKKGHCAKSTNDQTTFWIENSQEGSPAIDCCAFLPQLFNKVRKAESRQQIAQIPAKLEINLLLVVPTDFKPSTFFNYRPRLFNRGDTYLKNRVFRI